MFEVWLVVRLCMEVFGWSVSYFLMGLFVARRIRPPVPGWVVAFRLGAAFLWPLVTLFLVGRWFAMNGLLFMSDHIRTVYQWLEDGKTGAGSVATPSPTEIPAKNREAERRVLEALQHAEKKRGAKNAPN